MRHAARHEPIGRAIGRSPIAVMTMADVVLRANPDYPQIKTFHCGTLRCDITKEACAANFTRSNAPLSCKGCAIGSAHAGGENYRKERGDIHAKSDAAIGLSCIRCERNEHTATRFTGRFRLVRNHSLCISCVNREYECVKGTNSKGVAPRKWAHLQQATVTIEDAAGEWQTLDIGLRSGRGECERYVARIHPGCVLVEVFIGGNVVQPGDPDPTPADWKADALRKGHATIAARKKKPLPVASDREAFSDVDDYWPSRNAAWVEPVESALDPGSIAAYWDLTADGLPDFIEWLTDGWPEAAAPVAATLQEAIAQRLEDGESLGRISLSMDVPIHIVEQCWREVEEALEDAPVESLGRAADAIALPEGSVTVLSDSEQPEHESEWAGCYIVRDGVTTYVCDYAKERGISDEEAAIVLGMCDPEYADGEEDEPQVIDSTANLKSESCAKCTNEPPKKLTGKQQRKLERAQRRAERQQQQTATHMPATKARAGAIAARALAIFDSMGTQAC